MRNVVRGPRIVERGSLVTTTCIMLTGSATSVRLLKEDIGLGHGKTKHDNMLPRDRLECVNCNKRNGPSGNGGVAQQYFESAEMASC